MADRICPACGAPNTATATFCRVCDTYIDWTDPTTAPTADPADGATGEPDEASAEPDEAETPTATRRDPRAEVPVVTVDDTVVVVAPGAPGTTTVDLRNASDIVDGIVIHPEAAPSWLVVTHDDAHLMPGESRAVGVTFTTRPGVLVVAQETSVPLVVRSSVDPEKLTQVVVRVAVPRVGPPPTVSSRPALVHLQDTTDGWFTVSFDNRGANFPRRYRLALHDPEDVVRAHFLPPVVDVPAGETVDVGVRFAAPAPEPGRDVTRQLTVTGTGDDEPVSATATLTQRTSAAPVHVPVTLRLEPSHLRATDGEAPVFDVLVDNRAGHSGARVTLTGRDAQGAVAFSFAETRVVVAPGTVATVRARARSTPPAPGTTESRPFAVVANDGTSEVETAGILEVSARAAPITTARIRVEPATLATEHRQGSFLVQVDNRHGADTLQVQLAGADEFGRARLTFTPPVMAIAPGQVGTARLVVDSPTPPAGKTSSRRLRVSASDGRAAIEAEAVLAQSTPDHRPAAKRWLVVLGALLAMVGALIPWLGEMIDPDSIVRDATNAFGGDASAYAGTATAGSTVLVFLLALLMLLGLNGSSGRGIRFAALLMVIVAVAAAVVGADTRGLPLVLLGAVFGFIGGVLARSPR
ncbi:zinc ribbon domain-containing protein [Cellulomonas humilata]|uniref:Zinc ribbon domain-containing protein n=1 Tax=Cellulomonas humilata TaxID=144055 RepID=A0A7Y6DVS7_9CELL|nr:zinc ribbon domain-containing protein [Cellulomonas humilata]NUU16761.1 zinc ribbon domain-containing protein [Cellulomonas humilata]